MNSNFKKVDQPIKLEKKSSVNNHYEHEFNLNNHSSSNNNNNL